MSTAFRIELDNVQEDPDTTSTATGYGTAVFNSANVTLSYSITVTGLDFGDVLGIADQTPDPDDDVHGIHVHNAARGANGGVVFGQYDPAHDFDDFAAVLNSDGSTTFSGIWETSDPTNTSISNFAAMLGSATLGADVPLYWNIHTEEFPNGAIRGQLVCIATDNGETVEGTDGNDVLMGLGGNDIVNGGQGDDTLLASAGESLTGNGDDTLNGGPGTDTVSYANATSGVSVLATGTHYTDTKISIENLIGSKYADILIGDVGDNGFSGGSGDDTFYGYGGVDIFNGDAGNDTLLAGASNDTLNGGADDDILNGHDGDDVLNGGSGNDTAHYGGAPSGVTVVLGTTSAQDTGGAGIDTTSGIENLVGSNFVDTLSGTAGDNVLSGYGENDTLLGYSGNDTLNGDNGNDTLNGGNNNDIMNGGAGTDTVTYAKAPSGVTVSLGTTDSQDTGGDGFDTLTSIENLIGSNFADTLSGSASDNTISGSGGADTLTGYSGHDTLNGENGNDTLNGGNNNDILNGGDGRDTASYANAAGGVTVALSTAGWQDTIGDGFDTLTSIENLIGSNFADTLSGSTGDNSISGGGNNDNLKGFSGVDTLNGDNGNDTLNGGANNDTLNGGANDDDLIGQDGDDTLTGACGADEFIVQNNHGADTVTDFQNGSDTVRLIGVTGVNDFGDLTLTDTGPGVLVDYGTGTILLATVSDINTIDAGDFSFA